MKKYIQPAINFPVVNNDEFMETMIISDTEGYDDPMVNESTFDEGDIPRPKSNSVWFEPDSDSDSSLL